MSQLEELGIPDIIYGTSFPQYREQLRQLMMNGQITVTLDYNRSPWPSDKPEGSIVYRPEITKGDDMLHQSDWYDELKKALEKDAGKPMGEWHKIEPQEYDVFFGFDKGDDMSEQKPDYPNGAREYRVDWHNGEVATYSYILADDIHISDTGVLFLKLAGEIQFFSQTWTSAVASNKLPKE